MRALPETRRGRSGIGQLTLVEHALCPLDGRQSLRENLVHQAGYRFSDARGRRRTARARVLCPLGLLPSDELYLWGLLALTMSHGAGESELRATPHWCLRQLNLIDAKLRRGGRQYQEFAASLRRLSTVSYLSDNFYDPVRCEHRQVSFGFLSYSLPHDPNSSRAWRIAWDPVFFEVVRAAAGHFRFDLEVYRKLDAAGRRLFLFASKVFARRATLPPMALTDLGRNLLGFAPTVATRDLRVKVSRCIERLQSAGVIGDASIERVRPGDYRVSMTRGSYYTRKKHENGRIEVRDGPLWETLINIGFEAATISRLMKRYPHRLLSEWADITQAAQERFGRSFFRRSPMAFLVDSVSKAAKGTRTPPDWWRELRHEESAPPSSGEDCKRVFEEIRRELFAETEESSSANDQGKDGLMSVGRVFKIQN